MVNLMDFFCPCGMAIRVPRKQAGQYIQCPRCGNAIQIPTMAPEGHPLQATQQVNCPYCGQANWENSPSCCHCGQPLKAIDPPKKSQAQKSGGSVGRKIVFLFVSILFLTSGFSIGILSCPGYLSIVPPGYHLFPQFFQPKIDFLGEGYGLARKEWTKFMILCDQRYPEKIPDGLSKRIENVRKSWISCPESAQHIYREAISSVKKGKDVEDWYKKSKEKEGAHSLYLFLKEGRLDIPLQEESKKLSQMMEKTMASPAKASEAEIGELVSLFEAVHQKSMRVLAQLTNAHDDFRGK